VDSSGIPKSIGVVAARNEMMNWFWFIITQRAHGVAGQTFLAMLSAVRALLWRANQAKNLILG
jgi:hypothetical protein